LFDVTPPRKTVTTFAGDRAVGLEIFAATVSFDPHPYL
jgi:hypothetical protein